MREERRIQNSSNREMRLYLKEVSQIPLLTVEEERELGRRAQNGDKDAVQKLIEANLRFVIKVAKKYRKSGLPLLDLINEGNVGLIEAARRFDPEREIRFTSYAVWWIRQAILHYLADSSYVFRITPKTANILYRVGQALAKRKVDENVFPAREKLANEIGVSLKDLNSSLEATAGTYSLEHPLTDDGNLLLADTLEQTTIPSPETSAITVHMKQQIADSLSSLSMVERNVLRLRFGLEHDNPMTLREIGDKMHLSRERIRQIEMQALNKLRSSDSLATYVN